MGPACPRTSLEWISAATLGRAAAQTPSSSTSQPLIRASWPHLSTNSSLNCNIVSEMAPIPVRQHCSLLELLAHEFNTVWIHPINICLFYVFWPTCFDKYLRVILEQKKPHSLESDFLSRFGSFNRNTGGI